MTAARGRPQHDDASAASGRGVRELQPRGRRPDGDLAWPLVDDDEVGRCGVETDHPSILVCGAGARTGGGVSGVGGHNAAMAVLARPEVTTGDPGALLAEHVLPVS